GTPRAMSSTVQKYNPFTATRTSTPLFFLLQPHGAPRDLPSFPTRRSSDLIEAAITRAARGDRELIAAMVVVGTFESHWSRDIQRSEEHTSELQSRENLVCRLLLEKKKNHHFLVHNTQITYSNQLFCVNMMI